MDTKTQILSRAEQLMRTRGYNGFSYGDIAEAVGTTRANIHHHFKAKEDLGRALIAKTKELMVASIAELEDRSSIGLLKHYIGFFEQSIDNNLVCLCGMLLAENDSLPDQLRCTNQEFVDWQLDWLKQVLSSGRKAGEITFEGAPTAQANFIYSSIQRAHIVAKSRKDHASFSAAMNQLLSQLTAD